MLRRLVALAPVLACAALVLVLPSGPAVAAPAAGADCAVSPLPSASSEVLVQTRDGDVLALEDLLATLVPDPVDQGLYSGYCCTGKWNCPVISGYVVTCEGQCANPRELHIGPSMCVYHTDPP